jgi:hypothetical protein
LIIQGINFTTIIDFTKVADPIVKTMFFEYSIQESYSIFPVTNKDPWGDHTVERVCDRSLHIRRGTLNKM